MAIKIELKYGTGIKVFSCMFMLLIVFLLSACKSTKTVTSVDVKAKTVERLDVTSKQEATKEVERTVNVTDHSIISNALDETITDVIWSAPDSSGVQHKVRETVTVRSGKKISAANIIKTENNKELQKVNSIVVDKSKKNSTVKTEVNVRKTTKIKTPGVLTWTTIIPVVVVLIFVYLFLKKRKII